MSASFLRFKLIRSVRIPERAAARAASLPAWPPPTTITSNELFEVLGINNGVSEYAIKMLGGISERMMAKVDRVVAERRVGNQLVIV